MRRIRAQIALIFAVSSLSLLFTLAWGITQTTAAALRAASVDQPRLGAQITATPLPMTPRPPLPTNTARPTRTPLGAPAAPTSTPIPAVIEIVQNGGQIIARVCRDCNRLRFRSSPGTAGEVLGILELDKQFYVVGRSDDSKWLQIVTIPDSVGGWVSVAYVVDLSFKPLSSAVIRGLPVAGTAVEASPTPTSAYLAAAGVPPYLSGLSARARQIVQTGQQMGNRRNVFSKVGDSITAAPQFLYPIGYGQYDLGGYGNLSGVVGFYSTENARTGNSFANESLAAGGGWTTETLITPGRGRTDICLGDSPLVCEYKLVKPAVALIMIGTNDSGSGSAEVFAYNLRQIVEISINMGVLPVISTIPPKNIDSDQEARVDAYNLIIRQIAVQYDIPLWDYYSQMVNAPNRGMSADNLHPSYPPDGAAAHFTNENLQYGYTIRNLNALQVLNAIWNVVLN